jgi:hypothetical protein
LGLIVTDGRKQHWSGIPLSHGETLKVLVESIMTLLFSCFFQEQVVRVGNTVAWFPISSQRIGGEPEKT